MRLYHIQHSKDYRHRRDDYKNSFHSSIASKKRSISGCHAGLDPTSSSYRFEKEMDSPSTLLRVVGLSNQGSSPV
jgi:hypothetical protein